MGLKESLWIEPEQKKMMTNVAYVKMKYVHTVTHIV